MKNQTPFCHYEDDPTIDLCDDAPSLEELEAELLASDFDLTDDELLLGETLTGPWGEEN